MNDQEWLKAARAAKGKSKSKINTRANATPYTSPKKAASKPIAKSPDFYRTMAAAREMHACPVCGSCKCERARNPHVNCEHD